MKRLSISAIRQAGHLAMSPMERWLNRKYETHNAPPPLFIIGAPRSGTSLLYELAITAFHFSYLSNAAHRFYRTPLAATYLFQSAIARWQGDFTSRYGHISGWGAPNEGGWIWQRWLQDGDWTDGSGFAHSSIDQLRRLTNGMAALLDAPFINKNVMHSNRLQLMHAIWPNAIFIEVKRDVMDNARSIVRAERASGGPEKHHDIWWSVRPKAARFYSGKTDTERAVAQIAGVTQDIAEDAKIIGNNRFLSIDYSKLCDQPYLAIQKIAEFTSANGCNLVQRAAVPDKFPVRPSRRLEERDEAAMAATLNIFNNTGNNIG